ncbi:MAG: efflux RND transporter periplasmic adaptor subunit [Draconibacterium sp.]|nr:efflux RND transporter periplasmic adaptor subunit [Draconibacterium sp.]
MNKIATSVFKNGLIVLLAIVLINCAPKQQVKMQPQKVNVIVTQQKNITDYKEFVGQIYGYKDISIRARVDGFLEGIHFREGYPVKKGQLLYTIDSQPFEAEVSSYQSKVAEAKTMYAKAEADLNRYKPLAESNAVSKADLDAAQAQYDAAESSVQAAEANLRLAKIKMGYTKILSPIYGIIGKTQAKIGEYVGKSQSTVVLNTVSRIDEIFVEFFLTESQYLSVMKHLGSADTLFYSREEKNKILELILADGSIHDSKGHISFLDRAIDSNTGSLLVQAQFENSKRIIRPGQYAKIRFPLINEDAIVIPQKCVIELQGQFSVFIVNIENIIETRQIVAGAKIDDFWVIEDGLKAGEKVVIDGVQKVRSGVEVNATEIEFESQSNSN